MESPARGANHHRNVVVFVFYTLMIGLILVLGDFCNSIIFFFLNPFSNYLDTFVDTQEKLLDTQHIYGTINHSFYNKEE
ncbi:hypothetical protein [Epilithonimonas hungarica]|uniref:hypothetical protein n=1 Tax=Epilithonimonas hungarica TaxID=454006 RepID=UPI0027D88B41|nr:hypothetical protein [Epilithonimonas hungarica]